MKKESSGPSEGGPGEEPVPPEEAASEKRASSHGASSSPSTDQPIEVDGRPNGNSDSAAERTVASNGVSAKNGNGNHVIIESGEMPEDTGPSLPDRLVTFLIGKPRNLADKSLFKHLSLVAILAWVGLGADGLSSSCYGPAEAFIHLGSHTYLGFFLAFAIMGTVFIISACYSHLIEEFPSGGGYAVASALLGRRTGAVAGCALLVDYMLTITVSIAAAGDALFGLLGPQWLPLKIPAEALTIGVLIVMNLRGVKESVQVLLPIFVVFLVMHIVLVGGTIGMHLGDTGAVVEKNIHHLQSDLHNPAFGFWGMLGAFLLAYSLGASSYTGIEAVSNSMAVMREPRVFTAKKTMRYMAISLALMVGGLIIAYLLLDIRFDAKANKTMNQLLAERFVGESWLGGHWFGPLFISLTLISEGALLVVAAQTGFIGGPQVLSNMAQDSWMPRWFANLSERLATHNGILLIGVSALAALLLTHGDINILVLMYSINVFLTFSLSMIGMSKQWLARRNRHPLWRRRSALFLCGAVLCVAILIAGVVMKFTQGGYITVCVTGCCIGVSFFIHRYYRQVGLRLKRLDETLDQITPSGRPTTAAPDPDQPTAVILVGGYSGLGIHTMLNAIRFAPGHFKNFVFISAGVVDSGNFKGPGAVESLRSFCDETLRKYVLLSRRLGIPAASYYSVGPDAVDELEQICLRVIQDYPRSTFFAGQLVFQKDTWLHHLLHNQTAYSLQRRLQWAGYPMVILPTRVR